MRMSHPVRHALEDRAIAVGWLYIAGGRRICCVVCRRAFVHTAYDKGEVSDLQNDRSTIVEPTALQTEPVAAWAHRPTIPDVKTFRPGIAQDTSLPHSHSDARSRNDSLLLSPKANEDLSD